jgi:hypothetical protein
MKVGDLVCRKYVSSKQKQRVLKFNPNIKNIGVITKIDEEHNLCAAWFRDDIEETIFPISGDYLKIISESN